MKLFPFPLRTIADVFGATNNPGYADNIDHITLTEAAFDELLTAVNMNGDGLTINGISVRLGDRNAAWFWTVEGLSLDEVTQVMNTLGGATANAGRKLKWQMKLLQQHTRN